MLSRLVELVSLVVLIDVVFSWIQSPYQTPRRQLMQVTAPLYAPIRQFLKPVSGIDFSPLVLILLLQALAGFVR